MTDSPQSTTGTRKKYAKTRFIPYDQYRKHKRFIAVPVRPDAQTEEFKTKSRLSQNISIGRGHLKELYGADQAIFSRQMSEIALLVSYLLMECDHNPGLFSQKSLNYVASLHREPENEEPEQIFPDTAQNHCLQNISDTTFEAFLGVVALHRHMIGAEDHGFGINRYISAYKTSEIPSSHTVLSELRLTTHLGTRYLPVLTRYLERRNIEDPSALARTSLDKKFGSYGVEDVGIMEGENIHHHLVDKQDYVMLMRHMDRLFTRLISEDMSTRYYLDAVFEIQYWFIHISPYQRGSLSVMDQILYIFITYYNRQAAITGKPMLPLAPNRLDIIPGLEALLHYQNVENFKAASAERLYCVDYTKYY